MITKLLQNEIQVTEVKPNTPVRLATGGTGFWTPTVNYVVFDSNGKQVLNATVDVDFAQNAWLDWLAPSDEGDYQFFGNYANDKTDYLTFTVSVGSATPIPGGDGYIAPEASTGTEYTAATTESTAAATATQNPSNWWNSLTSGLEKAGIGVAVVAVVVLLIWGTSKAAPVIKKASSAFKGS